VAYKSLSDLELAVLRSYWIDWSKRLNRFAQAYDPDIIGTKSALEKKGVVVVLDAVPGKEDPLKDALLASLRANKQPAICLDVASLNAAEKRQFIADFRDVALDPMAQFATLYVTVDSSRVRSKETWELIDMLAGQNANEAVHVARRSMAQALSEPIKGRPVDRQEREYLCNYYFDFLDGIEQTKGNVWPIYGSPTVLDMSEDKTFKNKAEKRQWSYHGHASGDDLSGYGQVRFPLSDS
jgi:hypothetical protein